MSPVTLKSFCDTLYLGARATGKEFRSITVAQAKDHLMAPLDRVLKNDILSP